MRAARLFLAVGFGQTLPQRLQLLCQPERLLVPGAEHRLLFAETPEPLGELGFGLLEPRVVELDSVEPFGEFGHLLGGGAGQLAPVLEVRDLVGLFEDEP